MRRQWIYGCVVACLVGLCLTAGAETYPLASREYTVGVGAEAVDVFPADETLAGTVTIANGSQFLRDGADAMLDWRIVGPDDRVVAAGQDVALDDFAYSWNTGALPDGTYTVFFTVNRPGQAAATGSRAYRLVNHDYVGDEERALSLPLQCGWNLVALPFRVDAEDAPALFAQHPVYCAGAGQAYLQAGESLPAGCALWVYAEEEQEVSIVTRYALEAPPVLPPFSRKGWQLTGICGSEPLVVDCPALGIAVILRWNGFRLEEVPIATTGLAVLEPKTGYFLDVK